jgi:hypothetical protein
MKIMGLTETAYFASWYFHYFCVFSTIAFFDTVFLTYYLMDNASFVFVLCWMWIGCMIVFAKAILIGSLC